MRISEIVVGCVLSSFVGAFWGLAWHSACDGRLEPWAVTGLAVSSVSLTGCTSRAVRRAYNDGGE